MRLKKHKYGLVLLIVVFSFFLQPFSEVVGKSLEKREMRSYISQYLENLSEAYKYSDPKLVRSFLGKKQYTTLANDISQLKKQNLVLICDLNDLEIGFLSDIKKREIVATTNEQWSFYYIQRITGYIVGEKQSKKYNVVYNIINEKGNKIIDHIWVQKITSFSL